MYNIYILDSEMSAKLHCRLLLIAKIPSARTTSAVCLFKEHFKNIKTLNPPQLLQLLLQVRIPRRRPYTLSQQVIVAACGAARCGYRFSFRYRFRFRLGFEFGHKKHFHFISFRCMRCELKGKATREGGAKKYASGRNLCQVTQPGLGDECWVGCGCGRGRFDGCYVLCAIFGWASHVKSNI